LSESSGYIFWPWISFFHRVDELSLRKSSQNQKIRRAPTAIREEIRKWRSGSIVR